MLGRQRRNYSRKEYVERTPSLHFQKIIMKWYKINLEFYSFILCYSSNLPLLNISNNLSYILLMDVKLLSGLIYRITYTKGSL